MAAKKGGVQRKAAKKLSKKTKPAKHVKTRNAPKKAEPKKPPALSTQVIRPSTNVEPPVRERPRITIGTIRGDTAIGDLLVTFPRTREVLAKVGLRLEAEDAGDIYMTLDAFSAMNGLKTEKLVLDIVEVAKEPPPQPQVPQLVPTPAI
jgi:hypothetical protein